MRRENLNLLSILKSNKFLRKKRVGLAVSGGVDSMTMLDVFNKLRKRLNLIVYVLHYNHKWRKKSYLDVKLVKKYCEGNKINFLLKEAKGKVIKKEEEARKERYMFFRKVTRKEKLDYICTAHHKDDQIETILFRLLRGTGPGGVIPIKDFLNLEDNVRIYRPLLNYTKEQICEYARKQKLKFVYDVTNDEIKYKRNLIRKKITPYLSSINKSFGDNLLRFCNLVYSNYIVVSDHFISLLKLLSCKRKEDDLSSLPQILDRRKFLLLNEQTQRIFLYWLMNFYSINGSIRKIDLILKTLRKQGSLDLNKNLVLTVNRYKIFLVEKKPWDLEKDKNNHCMKFTLNTKKKGVKLDNNVLEVKPYFGRKFVKKFPCDKEKVAYVDFAKFKGQMLSLRYRKSKDIFCPLGSSYTVKLKNYLINKKVSREVRYKLPLLCFDNKVLWIPGYSLSEDLRVREKPTHILKLMQVLN